MQEGESSVDADILAGGQRVSRTDEAMRDSLLARVLLVGDNHGDDELIRLMLREAEVMLGGAEGSRFDITSVHLSERVSDLADCDDFDAVLLVVAASKDQGLSTVSRMAELHPHLPIVVLVETEVSNSAIRLVRAGAEDYLVKSRADGMTLARTIGLAIERNRRARMPANGDRLWARAVEGANEGMLAWDRVNDRVTCSCRAQELLGIEAEASSETWLQQVLPDDLPGLHAAIEALTDGRNDRLEHQCRIARHGDTPRWILLRGTALHNADGQATGLACLVSDVTARKLAQDRLLHDAFHDSLTGLANRALFLDRLEQLLARSRRRTDVRFAMLFFDLDGFKAVNDTFGHSVGDKLLVAIAQRLQQRLRPMDAIARFGGDELAVLINDSVDLTGAVHVAHRVLGLLDEGFEIDGNRLVISASIGIVLSTPEHHSAEEVLRQADIAMYRAKAGGKAQCEVFDRDMHRSALALLEIEQELRRAVQRHQFVMHYQPIVSLRTGKISGFEGLVRWQHPRRGLIEPSRFIAVAEESGLIVPIGWWVLSESCRQIRLWQELYPMNPPLEISVNISKKMFLQADMVDRVVEILQQSQLHPESLRLEIRENVVVEDGEPAITKLLELRALGVRVTVDDFGTGYSSLAYLRRFQCESVKIDPSFVSRINQPGESRTLVESILTLADTMGLGVIAEGVETEDQVGCLRDLRCPHGQGYWFARPLPPEAAEQLIAVTPRW